MTQPFSLSAFCAALLISSAAFAHNHDGGQHSGHGGHEGHGAAAQEPTAAQTAAVRDYEAVMSKMHQDMAITYTGDVDADFVRGMIPHHQGAIDMAKVLLEHGSDPRLKRLAQCIIAAQQKEINFMKSWLETREAAK